MAASHDSSQDSSGGRQADRQGPSRTRGAGNGGTWVSRALREEGRPAPTTARPPEEPEEVLPHTPVPSSAPCAHHTHPPEEPGHQEALCHCPRRSVPGTEWGQGRSKRRAALGTLQEPGCQGIAQQPQDPHLQPTLGPGWSAHPANYRLSSGRLSEPHPPSWHLLAAPTPAGPVAPA